MAVGTPGGNGGSLLRVSSSISARLFWSQLAAHSCAVHPTSTNNSSPRILTEEWLAMFRMSLLNGRLNWSFLQGF